MGVALMLPFGLRGSETSAPQTQTIILHAILRRCFSGGRFRQWYGGFCLGLGVVPLLLLGLVEVFLSRGQQLQSTLEVYRMVVILAAAITLPWAVWFWFVLLAANSLLYARRVAGAFGVPGWRQNPRSPTTPAPRTGFQRKHPHNWSSPDVKARLGVACWACSFLAANRQRG